MAKIKHSFYEYIIGLVLCSFVVLIVLTVLVYAIYLLMGNLKLVTILGLIVWMVFNIVWGIKLWKEYHGR